MTDYIENQISLWEAINDSEDLESCKRAATKMMAAANREIESRPSKDRIIYALQMLQPEHVLTGGKAIHFIHLLFPNLGLAECKALAVRWERGERDLI